VGRLQIPASRGERAGRRALRFIAISPTPLSRHLGEAREVASSVTVPVWLAIIVGVLAIIASIDRLFAPALRWWLRRRVNRAIDQLNRRLKVAIPPFKLARRSVCRIIVS